MPPVVIDLSSVDLRKDFFKSPEVPAKKLYPTIEPYKDLAAFMDELTDNCSEPDFERADEDPEQLTEWLEDDGLIKVTR